MQAIWKQRLSDSSWVTIAWDWVMTFLSRAAEPVLWGTMIYSCYQLIPNAPQPPDGISNFVFICQFISLDIGGMGLNKLAQRQGLALWTYPRILAYVLIAITLITVGYAGLEHVVAMPTHVTTGIEVTLVVIRSIMTVLYAQAIHDLKQQAAQRAKEMEDLRATLDGLRTELETTIAQATETESGLRATMDGLRATIAQATETESGLRSELRAMDTRATETEKGLRFQLEIIQQELENARAQATETEKGLRSQLEKAIRASRRATIAQDTRATMGGLRAIALVPERATGYDGRATDPEATGYVAQDTQATGGLRATDTRATQEATGYDGRATDGLRATDTRATIAQNTQAMDPEATGYVAQDDGTTLAIAGNDGQVTIATGSHRDRIKAAMLQAMLDGKELSYKELAQITQAGYSTVKKHAPAIREELLLEVRNTEKLAALSA